MALLPNMNRAEKEDYVIRLVLPILCTIWFILDVVASIIATLTSGTSYPISNVCTESSGKNSFPHSDSRSRLK
jgi:hypothetical protein